jgi:hypothetical protein
MWWTMTTAERIVVGIASLIALIGWLRWVGEARSHDCEMRDQHPPSSPKYQRPSNDEQIVATRQTVKWLTTFLRRLHRRSAL